jgi:uncharacterized protein (TIGR02453 family)
MKTRQQRQFRGFSSETFAFLRDIGLHNNKAWFEAHRDDYERHILQPLRGLVDDLAPFMLSIDVSFEVRSAVGKTISRIYRDTRFARDKRPFRDCMWIVFKRPGAEWSSYIPGYFLEIGPRSCAYGMGFYAAAPKLMARFRQQIDQDPDSFLEAIAWFASQDVFTLQGEAYKRPMGQDKPEPVLAWYRLKNFCLVCEHSIDDVILSSRLIDQLVRHFGLVCPLYHYLCRLSRP